MYSVDALFFQVRKARYGTLDELALTGDEIDCMLVISSLLLN
jgi:hypothetical protein